MSKLLRFYLLGFLFAMVWSSASVAAKIGLESVQPFMLYQARFLLAAVTLLLFVYLIQKKRLPKGREWLQLLVFGFLNITLALGLFVVAINEVAAGIGALQVGVNPLVMGIMAALVAGRKVKILEVTALVLGIAGVALAVYPLLLDSYATPKGLFLLSISSLAYSGAAIYYSQINWKLERLVINGWQSFFGAIFLIPFSFFFFEDGNSFDLNFAYSAFWLGVPVSVLAVSLWLWLLSIDTIKASYFLFLCPGFGLAYAYFILDEPFSWFTLSGLVVVMLALYVGSLNNKRSTAED